MSSNKIQLPINQNLPFFAYGLYKPGQLGFNRIIDFVRERENAQQAEIRGFLVDRDGIPLFSHSKEGGKIKGYLLKFSDYKKAYDRIGDIEPATMYEWQTVVAYNIETEVSEEANILVGLNNDKGTQPYNPDNSHDWDGKRDPYFSVALKIIKNKIPKDHPYKPTVEELFDLQMAYVLLWSAIERFALFNYKVKLTDPGDKREKIANDPLFPMIFQKHVKRKHTVYGNFCEPWKTRTLNFEDISPKNLKAALDYYYQVRSNSVHRGKIAQENDYNILYASIKELNGIFVDLLDASWKRSSLFS